MLHDTIKACRSYRRFDESEPLSRKQLVSWVDAARLTASSGNAQPLRFAVVHDEEDRARVFACCAWAKALPDWDGPAPGERPGGYIVVCRDVERTLADTFTAWDEGIVAQTIMLQAVEAGYGGCIVGSFKKRSLAEVLGIDAERFQPDLVLALGKPVEDVRIVDMPADGETAYWRDDAGVHYVPKRALADVLL
ncbi:nitroreductase family protein [Arabiibacter massiliensis]|uniref:nitroreductase family protein n=1 Tax=Arabiibacter massiliensis TaxID=1870985 RepID=UPI00155A9C59|nr:nitroreductase family protein [Arabiibacter massiliensis]